MSSDIAVVGIGVMGANLARNLHSRGLSVVVYDRDPDTVQSFIDEHGDERLTGVADYAELASSLKTPRTVLMMVNAGSPVDSVIADARPHLSPGDILIDGGNSHWPDTDRRHAALAADGLRFVGLGVSGGKEGALNGPSMMPGGDKDTWDDIRPLLEPAAAVSESGPCVAWCGHRSAGHAVKMVHNGIEYGDMQLISEVVTLMRTGLGMDAAEASDVFAEWNQGRLQSFLVEITATIVGAEDPETGDPLVDHILDEAGQKGTGRWTVVDAVSSGVAASTIAAAVDGRVLSARRQDRITAADRLGGEHGRLQGVAPADLEAALYASKIISYTQGFDLLATASEERGYDTDLASIARIWKAGCIIRARFLDRIHDVFTRTPDIPLLCLDPGFAQELREAEPAWRRVVAAAVMAGIPVPALSTSLQWFDTLRTERGSASIIQAQRDYFGAHTYRRREAPGVAVHTEWEGLERL